MSNKTAARIDLGTFSADGKSKMIPSREFRNATITLLASSSFAGTVKFYAANIVTEGNTPDLTVAAGDGNEYTTVRATNLSNGDPILGPDGVIFTGSSDGVSRYEIEDNNNDFIGVEVTGYSAGEVGIKLGLANNQ